MVIVDTTVWIDWINNETNPHTEWFEQNLSSQAFGLTSLILCEVLQGTRSRPMLEHTLRQLESFQLFQDMDAELAIAAARNYQQLRSRGITVRTTVDCMIATFCIRRGYTLLHHDRDFDHFEREIGLKVVRV